MWSKSKKKEIRVVHLHMSTPVNSFNTECNEANARRSDNTRKTWSVLKDVGGSWQEDDDILISNIVIFHVEKPFSGRDKDLRFLHVLTLCGVWLGKRDGASQEESPKLDRTLSILIISASTRGLTGGKQSSSISSLWGSGKPAQTHNTQPSSIHSKFLKGHHRTRW